MRYRMAAFALALMASAAALPARAADPLVYVGTQGSGPGQGIFAARIDPRSGHLTPVGLAAEIARPTWQVLSADHHILYSVSETGNDGKSQATVHALAIDPATGLLHERDAVASGGGGATHLALDPRSETLFVANYGTGTVAALPIAADGSLDTAASVQQDRGSGPTPRQTGPHAHSVMLDPSGHFLIVADLGADRVFVYHFDPATRVLTPATPPFVAAAAGSGPRHTVFHPNGKLAFINSELTGEITAYRWDARHAALTPIKTVSTFAPGFDGKRSAAELALSKDGRFLYVSNRNEGSLVAYRVDAASGDLSEVQRLPAGSAIPWSFSIAPDGHWLLVANQVANNVTVFRLDPTSGRLTATGESLSVPSPVSVSIVP